MSDLNYQTQSEYTTFIKPEWAPPPSTFGTVWGFLYITIFITDFWIFMNRDSLQASVIPLYILNIVANVLYMPATFGKDNWSVGTILIGTTLMSLLAGTVALMQSEAPWWIIALQIPYIIWMFIATTLHVQIGSLNNKI